MKLLNVIEFGAKHDLGGAMIRHLIRAGRLDAIRVGNAYRVAEDAVIRPSGARQGRPRKQKARHDAP